MKAIARKKPSDAVMPEIKPSAAIEGEYYRLLMGIIRDIRTELDDALVSEYHDQAKRELANDGISDWIAHVADYLLDKWNRKLDGLGKEIAKLFVDKTVTNYDARLTSLLRRRGFTVRMQNSEKTLDALRAASEEELTAVPDIGGITARSLLQWFQSPQSIHLIDTLREAGVNLESHEEPVGDQLAGKIFV